MQNEHVVITGSNKGLGFNLARVFLSKGDSVMISGRSSEANEKALLALQNEFPKARVFASVCDVTKSSDTDALLQKSVEAMGSVTLWVNNSGVNQKDLMLWELDKIDAGNVFHTNVGGLLNGIHSAVEYFKTQSVRENGFSGSIWFTEGHGSNGSIIPGLSLYGATKYTLRYLANALSAELKKADIQVQVGTISPGIMATDFILDKKNTVSAEAWERSKRLYNILADKSGTVADFLVPRMKSAKKARAHIAWLTTGKVLLRFLTASFIQRKIIE